MNETQIALGLDIGTSGADAIAVDHQGQVIAHASASYPLLTPKPGWTEQRPQDWWAGSCDALTQLMAALAGYEVVGIGLTGQMHGMVALDAHGQPLRPALLWNDQRTGAQIAEIEQAIPRAEMIARCGNPAITGFQLPKVLWLRAHESEVFARTRHIAFPKDFISYKLTGELVAEPTDASGSNCYHLKNRTWDTDVLRALDLDPTLYPTVVASHEVIGNITSLAAQATGLPEGLPVIAGAGDNAAAGIGLGLSSTYVHRGSISLGTSGVIFAPIAAPTPDPEGRVHLFAHADGGFNLLGVTLSAAGSLQWFRDTLAPQENFAVLSKEAAKSPVGARGLIFKPYLAGERTPHMNPELRASWHGLSLATERADLVRSVLEGVSCSLRDALEVMKPLSHVTELLTTGGGSQSALWMEITSTLLNLPLLTPTKEQGAAFGAALLAFQGTEHIASAATLAPTDIKTRYTPTQEISETYQEVYQRYVTS